MNTATPQMRQQKDAPNDGYFGRSSGNSNANGGDRGPGPAGGAGSGQLSGNENMRGGRGGGFANAVGNGGTAGPPPGSYGYPPHNHFTQQYHPNNYNDHYGPEMINRPLHDPNNGYPHDAYHPHHPYPQHQPYPHPPHNMPQQQQMAMDLQYNYNYEIRPRTHFEKCTSQTRSIAHYRRLLQIGEGTYGQVYKAQCLSTNRTVALKKIRLSRVEDGIPRNVIREIKILKAMKHENMVQMIEVVSSKGYEHLDEDDERKDEKKRRLNKEQNEKEVNKGNSLTYDCDHYKMKNNLNSPPENSNNKNTSSKLQNQKLLQYTKVDAREKYKGNLFLVLEYVSHDLSGILDMGHRFSPVESKYIFRQLLSVLDYMHKRNNVNRDMKS